jgi:F0F1-type ATP synthase assembly protein I
MIIVCEGRLTEPSYFDALARDCGAFMIVDLILVPGAGVPLSVVKKARQMKGEAQDEYSERDQT